MFGIGDKLLAIIGGGTTILLALILTWVVISKNHDISNRDDQITVLGHRLDACNADRLTLKANQGTLEASLQRANSSISDLQASAATKYSEGATERVRASEAAHSASTRADAIAQRKPGADGCKSADDLILESLK